MSLSEVLPYLTGEAGNINFFEGTFFRRRLHAREATDYFGGDHLMDELLELDERAKRKGLSYSQGLRKNREGEELSVLVDGMEEFSFDGLFRDIIAFGFLPQEGEIESGDLEMEWEATYKKTMSHLAEYVARAKDWKINRVGQKIIFDTIVEGEVGRKEMEIFLERDLEVDPIMDFGGREGISRREYDRETGMYDLVSRTVAPFVVERAYTEVLSVKDREGEDGDFTSVVDNFVVNRGYRVVSLRADFYDGTKAKISISERGAWDSGLIEVKLGSNFDTNWLLNNSVERAQKVREYSDSGLEVY